MKQVTDENGTVYNVEERCLEKEKTVTNVPCIMRLDWSDGNVWMILVHEIDSGGCIHGTYLNNSDDGYAKIGRTERNITNISGGVYEVCNLTGERK